MTCYPKFPKIPRLDNVNFTITEKIDGTNGLLLVLSEEDEHESASTDGWAVANHNGYGLYAGSRTRWLDPDLKGGDNFGFAAWARENAVELIELLGPGHHYGEWHGRGIQRGYGMEGRWFALFNVHRWKDHVDERWVGINMTIVPLLSEGITDLVKLSDELRRWTSTLAPTDAEGLVITERSSGGIWKVIFDHPQPKGGRRDVDNNILPEMLHDIRTIITPTSAHTVDELASDVLFMPTPVAYAGNLDQYMHGLFLPAPPADYARNLFKDGAYPS